MKLNKMARQITLDLLNLHNLPDHTKEAIVLFFNQNILNLKKKLPICFKIAVF